MFLQVLLLLVAVSPTFSWDNGVGRLPPMGYNPWSTFWCQVDCKASPTACISERVFKTQMDQMHSLGLVDAGYTYFNLDDCWSDKSGRDPKTGKLRADPTRFPNGLAHLSQYATSKGLSLGMYSDIGPETCGGYPGSGGHEKLDVETFINDWNITYLKLDGCHYDVSKMKEGYTMWSKLLGNNMTSRRSAAHPMVFSCSWPAYESVHWDPEAYIGKICHLWRFYNDIRASYGSVWKIIDYVATNQQHFAPYSLPYQHNDPDMLVIGHKSMSSTLRKTMFGLWAMMAAPLLISDDLTTISKDALDLYLNEEVIAIDQDPLVVQGVRTKTIIDTYDAWVKRLQSVKTEDGDVPVYAVAFTSRSLVLDVTETVAWDDIQIPGGKYHVRDVFKKKNIGTMTQIKFTLKAGDTLLLKLVTSS